MEVGSRDLICLDGDGVLIDYHEGYARAWEKAFGFRPGIACADGYHPSSYWAVPRLNTAELDHFVQEGLNAEAWRTMPAIPGALSACLRLREAGYRLVCVTALAPELERAREENLKDLGFPIERTYAVGVAGKPNPKQALLTHLRPAAFVDDYLGYLQQLPKQTWTALVEGRPFGNPNQDPTLVAPHSRHTCLADFTSFWLEKLENSSGLALC